MAEIPSADELRAVGEAAMTSAQASSFVPTAELKEQMGVGASGTKDEMARILWNQLIGALTGEGDVAFLPIRGEPFACHSTLGEFLWGVREGLWGFSRQEFESFYKNVATVGTRARPPEVQRAIYDPCREASATRTFQLEDEQAPGVPDSSNVDGAHQVDRLRATPDMQRDLDQAVDDGKVAIFEATTVSGDAIVWPAGGLVQNVDGKSRLMPLVTVGQIEGTPLDDVPGVEEPIYPVDPQTTEPNMENVRAIPAATVKQFLDERGVTDDPQIERVREKTIIEEVPDDQLREETTSDGTEDGSRFLGPEGGIRIPEEFQGLPVTELPDELQRLLNADTATKGEEETGSGDDMVGVAPPEETKRMASGGNPDPDTGGMTSTESGGDGTSFSAERLVGAVTSGNLEGAFTELKLVPPGIWLALLVLVAVYLYGRR